METFLKRKPIVALLLSFITPGLGQVYNGRLIKGIVFYLVGFLLAAVLLFSGLFFKFYGLIFCLVILLLFFLFILVDAFIGSIKLKEITLKPYNQWYIYLIFFLINIFIIQPLAGSAIKNNIVRAYKIPSGGMDPTILSGDRLIANMKMYKREKPKRGDVVIFKYPVDRSKDFIKRVIGLPGETVQIINKRVYINNQPMEDPSGIHTDQRIIPGTEQPRDNTGPIIVSPNKIFVMGDNRDGSFDSRYWGFVDISALKGKALYIYWAKDKRRIGNEIR
jgi:signal peptidase I